MNNLRESSGEHPVDDPNTRLLRTYEGMMKLTVQAALEKAATLSNSEDRDALTQALRTFLDSQDSSILYAPIREGGPRLVTAMHEATGSDQTWQDLSGLIQDIKTVRTKTRTSSRGKEAPPKPALKTGTGSY